MTLATLALATLATAAPAGSKPAAPRTLNVAIVLYDGVEVLDFAGPAEVLSSAGDLAASRGVPATRVYTMASRKDPIVSQGFVRIVPEFSVDDAPTPDIVVIPGGNSNRLTDDPRFMSWLAGVQGGATTLTVCTGAFAAWKAGMLDGLTATTHYGSTSRLRQVATKTTVVDGRRFVDNGKVITTAGVSAGIDGALHLVARRFGRAVADRTAQYMEYHWTPEPWLAKDYAYLNPSLDERGRALQQADLFRGSRSWADAVRAYRAVLALDPDDANAWLGLVEPLVETGDGKGAMAAAKKATGYEATRGEAWYATACLYARSGQRTEALDAVERAASSGFKAWWALEQDDDLASVRADPRFQAVVARMKAPPAS